MAPIKSEYLSRELRRWARPDAHHFARPDWRRYVTPGSDAAALFELYERKWRVDQLRDWRGRFADEGGGTDAGAGTVDSGPNAAAAEAAKPVSDITGFTKHGIDRAINRGVSPAAMLDAVVRPLQILPQANGTTRYIGAGAVVVLNPAGGVVTVWRR